MAKTVNALMFRVTASEDKLHEEGAVVVLEDLVRMFRDEKGKLGVSDVQPAKDKLKVKVTGFRTKHGQTLTFADTEEELSMPYGFAIRKSDGKYATDKVGIAEGTPLTLVIQSGAGLLAAYEPSNNPEVRMLEPTGHEVFAALKGNEVDEKALIK